MAALILMLELAAFLLVYQPMYSLAADSAASKERGADSAQRANSAVQEKIREREKRFIIRTIDELKESISLTEDEIQELEKEIDSITLLESPRRGKDFADLLDWYHGYDDWLQEEIGVFEDHLVLFSTGTAPDRQWKGRYAGLMKKRDKLARDLEKRVKRYDAEEKRLAGIIERRRELRERFDDLQFSLARIEERINELQGSERRESERKAEKHRKDIRVVQNELLSLPQVDEDLQKHYAVLVERGEGEVDWLSLKSDEQGAMQDIVDVVGLDPRRNADQIEAAYRRVGRALDATINRLSRKMDELDRKRSRMTPAGSLKEVDRSRELADFYERLKGRYENEIRRLRVLVGAFDAELSEVMSDRDR